MLGIYILVQQGDWFGIGNYLSGSNTVLFAWFILSTAITGWLTRQVKEDSTVVNA